MVKITTHDYDVALSFAGEDREYVVKTAALLQRRGVRVFYDRYEEVDLWGKDIYARLVDVYKNKARYAVVFLSAHYAKKLWCKHELRSAQARAFEEAGDYILTVKFDDTELPGILPTTGYLDLRRLTPSDLAKRIREKLSVVPSSLFDVVTIDGAQARIRHGETEPWRNRHTIRFLYRPERRTEVEISIAKRTESLDSIEIALVQSGPHYIFHIPPDWPLEIAATPYMDWLMLEMASWGLKCHIDGRLLRLYFPQLKGFRWLNATFYAPPCWHPSARTGTTDPANSRSVTFNVLQAEPFRARAKCT